MGKDNFTEELIRVRYAETDQMGHAYYANYLVWFEQARSAFFRDRGFSYKEIEAIGYKLPVVEANAKYKAEVKYDDEIIVKVWVDDIKRAAIKIDYEVWNHGILASEGYTWHVLVGADFKATRIPPSILEILERPSQSQS